MSSRAQRQAIKAGTLTINERRLWAKQTLLVQIDKLIDEAIKLEYKCEDHSNSPWEINERQELILQRNRVAEMFKLPVRDWFKIIPQEE